MALKDNLAASTVSRPGCSLVFTTTWTRAGFVCIRALTLASRTAKPTIWAKTMMRPCRLPTHYLDWKCHPGMQSTSVAPTAFSYSSHVKLCISSQCIYFKVPLDNLAVELYRVSEFDNRPVRGAPSTAPEWYFQPGSGMCVCRGWRRACPPIIIIIRSDLAFISARGNTFNTAIFKSVVVSARAFGRGYFINIF